MWRLFWSRKTERQRAAREIIKAQEKLVKEEVS
jgi:hypothetical protein